jgi:hypothetical protein
MINTYIDLILFKATDSDNTNRGSVGRGLFLYSFVGRRRKHTFTKVGVRNSFVHSSWLILDKCAKAKEMR